MVVWFVCADNHTECDMIIHSEIAKIVGDVLVGALYSTKKNCVVM